MTHRFSDPDALIRNTPLLRRLYDPDRDAGGRFVVSGKPEAWDEAEKTLQKHGGEVVAFHDIRKDQPRLHAGRPVIRGRIEGRYADAVTVFAGRPTKHWFNPSPPGPEKCLWMVKPIDWQCVGRETPRIWNEQRPQMQKVFDLLADEPSREILASIVRARLEGDTGYHRISPYLEYDHPVVGAMRGDIVMDVGAYDGDTAVVYSDRVGSRGRVMALEPSVANYEKLVQRIRTQHLTNVTPLLLGAWNSDSVLRFKEGAGASAKIGDDGNVQVVVAPVDNLVADHRLPRIDVLKLDVEGAEKAALEGARKSLERFRPTLHISIYHRFDDLFELPLMLSEWLPRYRWYMGHHSYYQMETDLYGIPIERWVRGRAERAGKRFIRRVGKRAKALFSRGAT